jgi:arylsulfatase A-like enzyme
MSASRIIRIARVAGLLVSVALTKHAVARRAAIVPLGVVVITLDTTRADRLSPYGFMDISLPNLERLAREGVVFDQAESVAPLTLPAHTSLFTGLLPPNHGVRDNAAPPLGETHTTLPEVLLARGFRTGAFVGSIVLDPDRGLKQGFEEYRGVDGTHQRRADQVINDAVQWLERVDKSPFFLWTHLYDPHRPYDPPEPYATICAHNPYLGEIAFADAQVGRLLEALQRRGLLDRVIVVVAGDHGESLGQRGERDHGVFVYENVLRVPLIVRSPAVATSRVGEVVRLVDVMPTILDLLDVAVPWVDGTSLRELMCGRRSHLDLEAYAESLYPMRLGWSPLFALRHGRYKLIDAPRPELYDLDGDPFEQHNVYDERRTIANAMSARVAILKRGTATAEERIHLTADLRARLSSLGYLGSAAAGVTPESPLPDPKDRIATFTPRLR